MRIDLTAGVLAVDAGRDPGECVFEVLRGDVDDPDRTWFEVGGAGVSGVRVGLRGSLEVVEYRLNRATLPMEGLASWMGSVESVCLELRPDVPGGAPYRSILGVTWNLTAPSYMERGRWLLDLVSTFNDELPGGPIVRVWLDGFDPGLVYAEPEVSGRFEREEVV